MAHSMWTGTISFGLVSIPVKLMSATRHKGVSFNILHKKCHNRIQEKRFCPVCEEEVAWDDTEKGYAYAKDEYVSFSPEDFESLPLASKNVLEVESFVEIDEIDPIYFDSSYYLQPDKKGSNSYNLLRTALERKGMVAVGKIALRTKERLCIVRVYGSHLLVETLLYPDEIFDETEEPIASSTPSKQEMSIAEHLVDLMTKPFDPTEYTDNYREALEELVESKVSGTALKTPAKKSTGKVLDLMDALRNSVLSAQKGKAGVTKRNASVVAEDDEEYESPKRSSSKSKAATAAKKMAAPAKKASESKSVSSKTGTQKIAARKPVKKAPAKKAPASRTATKKKVTPIARKRRAS
jgi:DNA end-binding protein Ku